MQQDSQMRDDLVGKLNSETGLQNVTVLLVFLLVVIVAIYLISMLLIFIRKFKNILHSRPSTKLYYSVVFFYIASKLILCAILIVRILAQMPDQYANLKGQDIQIVFKNSIQLADLAILQLFFIALYFYLKLCFLAMDKHQIKVVFDLYEKKLKRILLNGVKLMILVSTLAFLVPLVIFDCKIITYQLLNLISTIFNSIAILIFLASFFFLNFKMTGLMMENKLNLLIKKIYKVLVIILVSRIIMMTIQLIIVFKIHDGSFQSFLQFFQQSNGQFVTLTLCFIGATIMILLTEGLPIMYSLKNTVIQAFSLNIILRNMGGQKPQSMLTSNSSVINDQILEKNIFEYDEEPEINQMQNLSLKRFRNLYDIKQQQDSIWTLKRGVIGSEDYIIKIAKHQISTYIVQDVQTEISKWSQLKLKYLNSVRYFIQNQYLCIVEKYIPMNLDSLVEKATDQKQIYLIALEIAKGIDQLHKNDITHGSLKPTYILFDNNKNLSFTGLGLLSLKKYLSLITGYTNKSMYSSTEILADKNNVTIKATKQTDIYSFGMIFYQIVTKNKIYREQTLKQCKERFAEEKARPKIPENLNPRTKALIRNCWQDSPIKRPTISEVILNLKKIIEQL